MPVYQVLGRGNKPYHVRRRGIMFPSMLKFMYGTSFELLTRPKKTTKKQIEKRYGKEEADRG